MRLLNIHERKFEIKEGPALDVAIKNCAIISHRWGNNETKFHDLEEILQPRKSSNGAILKFDDPEGYEFGEEEEGLLKIAEARKKAREYGFRGDDGGQAQETLGYIWMDTCCIDKTDGIETERAINSMFRWYRDAKVCFVYLSDVAKNTCEYQKEQVDKLGNITRRRRDCFEKSEWFLRGWTLQELLAPKAMCFFDYQWRFIGTKKTLSTEIQNAAKIEAKYLNGDFSDACTAVRMSWLSRRNTTLKDDMAYCMVGVFGVHMYIKYGEDEDAFLRLEEELIKQKAADESIFAWKHERVESCGLLAPWPTCFSESGGLTILSQKYRQRKPYTVTGGGIEFHAPNVLPDNGNGQEWMTITAALRRNYELKLNCWEVGHGRKNTVTLHLQKLKGEWRRVDCNGWTHKRAPRSSYSIAGPKTRPMGIPQKALGDPDWGHILAREEKI